MDHANLDSFIGDYGYLGIILALAGGIIGLPIPDELLLAFIGYCVSQSKMTYFWAVGSSFLGSITGITISYLLGKKLGLPFLNKFGPIMYITEDRIDLSRRLFKRWGIIVLFFGYFIPGVRQISAFIAAISHISFRRFVLYAYPGGLLWSLTFITLGQLLGKNWTTAERYINDIFLYAIGSMVVVGLFLFTFRLVRFRSQKG